MHNHRPIRLWNFRLALEDQAARVDHETAIEANTAYAETLPGGPTLAAAADMLMLQQQVCVPLSQARQCYQQQTAHGGTTRHDSLEAIQMALREHGEIPRVDLLMMRRRCAAKLHPDRVPARMKDWAARAMAEANALIDEALAKSPR